MLFDYFYDFGKSVVRTYFIENGRYFMTIRDSYVPGILIWKGEIPRLQYLRAFCKRRVALLDNGDITSSDV